MGGGVEESRWPRMTVMGGAELVAGVIDELPLRLIGGVNSIKHSVESTSQVGDFVFAVDGAREVRSESVIWLAILRRVLMGLIIWLAMSQAIITAISMTTSPKVVSS